MSEETPAGYESLPLCSAILSKELFLRRQPRVEIHKSFPPGPQRSLAASSALSSKTYSMQTILFQHGGKSRAFPLLSILYARRGNLICSNENETAEAVS